MTSVTLSQIKIMFLSETNFLSHLNQYQSADRCLFGHIERTGDQLTSARGAQGLLKIGQNPSVCHFAFGTIFVLLADNKCIMSEKERRAKSSVPVKRDTESDFTSVFTLGVLHVEGACKWNVLLHVTFETTCTSCCHSGVCRASTLLIS